jgi:hypothetical protein
MLNWLVGLWHKIARRFLEEERPQQVYHRSNLHGRHR